MTPFAQDPSLCIASLTEKALIERIREWLGPVCPAYPQGIGDDAAVFSPIGPHLKELITTDSIVWGIHCDESAQPASIGNKLLQRSVSDIAAMGASPTRAVVALLMGKDVSLSWLEAFYKGMRDSAAPYHLQIVGGDITGAPKGFFGANLTMLGCAASPILRHTGRPGDTLWVTGALGGSILGRHLLFKARLEAGRWLAHYGAVTAMMDLSDGLMSDLAEFTSPTLCAILDVKKVPIHPDARTLAAQTGRPAIEHALGDGEDYELLFALNKDVPVDVFLRAWETAFPGLTASCIGELRACTDPRCARIVDLSGKAITTVAYDSIREAP